MKEYFETKRMKSTSYLYYGLIAAALTALMTVAGILSIVRGLSAAIAFTAFAAAVIWGVAAFVSLYIFYADNRAELKSDKLDSEDL
ncbi:MAG: hypothetical protein NC395_08395 [Prevotella sp.]|nr:hypothetical protein [Prevotella sp.]